MKGPNRLVNQVYPDGTSGAPAALVHELAEGAAVFNRPWLAFIGGVLVAGR